MVYDLEGAGQSMVKTIRGQPIYRKYSKPLDQSTYDKILAVSLLEDESDWYLETSWVVLQSQRYKQLHVLTLRDFFKQQEDQNEDTLGGNFIKTHQASSLLLKIKENNSADFWDNIVVQITFDGSKAILQTQEETFLMMLRDSDADGVLNYCKIPHLSGKSP